MEMKSDTEDMKLKIQETLDELLRDGLIPFELTAQRVKEDGIGGYIVPFYDSRIHSFRFAWKNGDSFKAVVRAAVLERARKMSEAQLT